MFTKLSRLKTLLLPALLMGLSLPLITAGAQAQDVSVASAPSDVGIPKTFPVFYLPAMSARQVEINCHAAIEAAHAAGGGRVLFPDAGTAGITLSAVPGTTTSADFTAGVTNHGPLPLYSGISYIGVRPRWTYPTTLPDDDLTFTGGTWFKGDGTFDCFAGNALNWPNGTPPTLPQFAALGINGVDLRDIGIDTFLNGVEAGGLNEPGLWYSTVSNVWVRGCSGWGAIFNNLFHTNIDGLWCTWNVQGGLQINQATDALGTGNTSLKNIFVRTPNNGVVVNGATVNAFLSKGIEIGSFATTGGTTFGGITASHIQVNAYNRTTPMTATATLTSGSTAITVPSGAAFAKDLPLQVTTTTSGFVSGRTYVVQSVTGNTLTIANSRSGAAIAPTASGTVTLTSSGMPNFAMVGRLVNGSLCTVANQDWSGIDLEGSSSAFVYMESALANTLNIPGGISIAGGNVGSSLVLRSSGNDRFDSTGGLSTDFDSTSTNPTVFGISRGTTAQSSGIGMWLDASSAGAGKPVLSLFNNSGNTGDIQGRNSSGSMLYPNTPLGQHVQVLTGSTTLTLSNGGLDVLQSGPGGTLTLPLIVTDATVWGNSNIGAVYDMVNIGTGTFIAQTTSSQLFNQVASKTSYSIPAGGTLRCIAAKDSAGAVFWAAFPGSGTN